jgi:hypothetical protein
MTVEKELGFALYKYTSICPKRDILYNAFFFAIFICNCGSLIHTYSYVYTTKTTITIYNDNMITHDYIDSL